MKSLPSLEHTQPRLCVFLGLSQHIKETVISLSLFCLLVLGLCYCLMVSWLFYSLCFTSSVSLIVSYSDDEPFLEPSSS